MSRVVEWSIKKLGIVGPEAPDLREPPGLEETARVGIDHPGAAGPAGGDHLENAVVPDPIRAREPAPGRSVHPQLSGQPRGRSQAGHDAGVGVKKGPEELVAAAGGADQVQVFEHLQAGVSARFAFADQRPPARSSARPPRPGRGRRCGDSGARGPRESARSGRRPASPIRERRPASTSGTSRGTGGAAGAPC